MTSSVSHNGGVPGHPSKRYALRFISGKYQGGEFPLTEGHEVVVGRSSDLDMVLVEELVSRRHASILQKGDDITIEDLGSTNGTFVNGERVQKATLKEGDRVLIGTSILKVVPHSAETESSQLARRSMLGKVTERQVGKARHSEEPPRMTGSLGEIPLPDLLQLFGTSKKTGVLVLRSGEREGRIVLFEGKVRHAAINGPLPVAPLKAVYRMLDWQEGSFELDPPDDMPVAEPIDATAQEVLMEGIRQQDELNALRPKLPREDKKLRLRLPLTPALKDLSAFELEVLQLALNARSVSEVFDRALATDLDTATTLVGLLERAYLEGV
jgi:pSer/pThr/pTyr-binding forkhead associated (FHA) protein